MKKIIALILPLLLCLIFALSAYAVDSPYLIDDANLLTEDEEVLLLQEIEEVINTHSIDVVIHTTLDTNGKSIEDYCDDYYNNGNYSQDGLIFVISMAERDYFTSTCGTLVDAIPYNQIIELCEPIVPYLSNGDYYSAFSMYLEQIDNYLAYDWYESGDGDSYQNGGSISINWGSNDEYGYYTPSKPNTLTSEIILIVIGVGIAFLITTLLKKKMNTAVAKYDADDYMVKGSFNLDGSRDVFIGSNVTRRPLPKNNNNGSRPGGGGGVRVSSGGVRHGGGGGKF